ncbi:MAG: glycerophosphodiester phosphodiesterase family protein [Desulfuromonadaceae bacterium]|nr:glycerophosphodiester phosphodiesterase family protein [Desulfuromonadaceae bacterium]
MHTDRPHTLPLIIGHRGASRDAPENTLESFRLAREQGADGIEADFRLTADGQIICMHDEATGRTTGIDLNVAETPLEQLHSLDAGLWKGPTWAGARIPTLPEVLSTLPHDSWFFIELKCGAEIISPLKKVLQTSGWSPERVRLLSFSAPLIAELKQNLPDWRACWLCDYRHTLRDNIWHPSRGKVLDTLLRSGADGLASANRSFLDRNLVKAVSERGKEIHVWTVDRLPAAENLCNLGVNSIMTNRPGWLRQNLEELHTP